MSLCVFKSFMIIYIKLLVKIVENNLHIAVTEFMRKVTLTYFTADLLVAIDKTLKIGEDVDIAN